MTPRQAGEIAARARKLLRAGKLTHRQFALLDALLWSGRRPGSWDAVASYTALQRLAHQARSTVADGLRALAALGLLTIIKRRFRCGWMSRQGTSVYRFAPAVSESSRAPVTQEIEIRIEAPLPGPDLLARRRAWWESQGRRHRGRPTDYERGLMFTFKEPHARIKPVEGTVAIMNLYQQQRLYRTWLEAAGGDLRIVEQALISATRKAQRSGSAPTSSMIMSEIREIVDRHRSRETVAA